MKLAISNIAWERHDDPAVLGMLRQSGASGIEIAPTKVWPSWQGASERAASELRRRLAAEGFCVPALQAILFGRDDLQVFDETTWPAFEEHMRRVAGLAAALGAGVLVFGSPKNRRRGQLPMSRAMPLAVKLFRRLGAICAERGVCTAIEHNPPEYGCDFATCAADAAEIVAQVNSAGFALHLDAGGLHLCGGNIAEVIQSVGPFVHYHASEPMLENPARSGTVKHAEAAGALMSVGYDGWISLEMKGPDSPDGIREALQLITESYGRLVHRGCAVKEERSRQWPAA
jgi:sugar phosphate isomerase/epimerase